MNELFHKLAARCAKVLGSPWAFVTAILIIVVWAFTGPMFHYSDTWQLIINTSTTIITFLMVFIIQNSQNRDSKAIQLKLDELLRALKNARTKLVNLEDLPEERLDKLQEEFQRLARLHDKDRQDTPDKSPAEPKPR